MGLIVVRKLLTIFKRKALWLRFEAKKYIKNLLTNLLLLELLYLVLLNNYFNPIT
jgi:hypothetical protein